MILFWIRQVYHLSSTLSKWLASRVVVNDVKENPLHFQMLRLAQLNNMKFPIDFTSSLCRASRPSVEFRSMDHSQLGILQVLI
jgi:hypothetical protein